MYLPRLRLVHLDEVWQFEYEPEHNLDTSSLVSTRIGFARITLECVFFFWFFFHLCTVPGLFLSKPSFLSPRVVRPRLEPEPPHLVLSVTITVSAQLDEGSSSSL